MGLFDIVHAWLSPRSSAAGVEKELQKLLHACIAIVSAYGATLEEGSSGSALSITRPEADLPCSKHAITQAIVILQQALRHPGLRAILVQSLSPAEAQQILSSQFERSLETGLVFLDTFVAAAEVEAERKQWEDALKLVDKIDPAARARIENTVARARRVSPKK
jgi:hypothetical protein